MRATVATILLTALATVGCNQKSTPAEFYDNSATWTALNQSQEEGDFYNGMHQRLEKLGFVCTSQSEALNRCVKQAMHAECTYSEKIEFNSTGVSHYKLDRNCAA